MRVSVRAQIGPGDLRHEAGTSAPRQIKIHKLKEKDKKNALNEIRFLASIESPFVVSYKEAFYDEKSETLCIVMEYANQGDIQVLPSPRRHASRKRWPPRPASPRTRSGGWPTTVWKG